MIEPTRNQRGSWRDRLGPMTSCSGVGASSTGVVTTATLTVLAG